MSNANTSRLVNLSLLARYRHFIPFLFLVLMVFFSWRELSQLDWKALRSGIQDIPFFTLILLQLFGFIAVLLMTLYDWLLCRWLGITLPINKLTRFSWVANTFNNFIGLSGLAGSGIRYLLLSREGVPAKDGIIYSGTLMLSIPVGLAALAWVVLFKGQEYLTKIALPSWLTYTAVVLFAAYLGLFFLLTGKGPLQTRFNNTLASLNLFQRLQLIGVSLLDWTIAGVVAWACLWVSNAQTPVIVFLTAFVTANAFGVFSLVPGGLGVFDSTLLLALSDQGISSAAVLAGIVLYRLVYYIVPWIVGVYLGAGLLQWRDESRLRRFAKRWEESSLMSFARLPLGLVSRLGVRMLSVLTFFAGVVLLVSAAFPTLLDRLALLRHYVPLIAVEGSHLLSVATGVALIGLSRGIADQIKLAYRLAMVLLIGGALLSLLKGIDYEEALFLLLVAWLLYLRRTDFYRLSFPLLSARSFNWLLALLLVVGGYAILGALIHGESMFESVHWLRFAYSQEEPRFMRSLLVAVLSTLGFLGWILFRIPRPPLTLPDKEQLQEAKLFLQKYGENCFSHLIFIGDKYFFYSRDKRALIQYGRIRDRLVALGDPSGDEDAFEEAIKEFRDFADCYDLVPVFHEVSDRYLHLYHDLGFSLFKLGEMAYVSIADFSLAGKKGESLRHSFNRATKLGARFELLNPPFDDPTWAEVQHISDSWLAEKSVAEKGFSLGYFDHDYLSCAPLAVVTVENRPVAFANLMPSYHDKEELSIDLMRQAHDAPPGTMDFLFVNVIEYGRSQGYRYFNLGMAPLSGVGASRYSHTHEKLAGLAYEYGNRLYNYKGLRSFKEKFHPEWRSTYLVYPYSTTVGTLLLDTAALIAGGYWKILFKGKEE